MQLAQDRRLVKVRLHRVVVGTGGVSLGCIRQWNLWHILGVES
jgi:hypothetical protein